MSRELRHLTVGVTVDKPERLPEKDGRPMYADDVMGELQDVVAAAVGRWYEGRGRELLCCEPIVW